MENADDMGVLSPRDLGQAAQTASRLHHEAQETEVQLTLHTTPSSLKMLKIGQCFVQLSTLRGDVLGSKPKTCRNGRPPFPGPPKPRLGHTVSGTPRLETTNVTNPKRPNGFRTMSPHMSP